ncbi:MAG: PIN domain-containing protein [Nitrososphaerota archaeon]
MLTEVEEARPANDTLLKIVKGSMVAYSGILTWDEVVWVVWKIAGRQTVIKQGSALLSLPNLRLLSMDEELELKAQEVFEKYNLAPRESLHF